MLRELQISHFTLIDDQTIEFAPGLNVISGESGAGKSILLEALKFISGGRARSESIRAGREKLEVHALFDLSEIPHTTLADLPDFLKEALESKELHLSRELSRTARSKVYINGKLAPLSQLEQLGSLLVSVCGQSQHMQLLDPSYQLWLLDQFAGNSELAKQYSDSYLAWKSISNKLNELEKRISEASLRRAQLEFVLEELSQAELKEGRRSELEKEIKLLSEAEASQICCANIEQLISDGIYETLGQLKSELIRLRKFRADPELLVSELAVLEQSLFDIETKINHTKEQSEVNEESLASLRTELDLLARLERKYKRDEKALLELKTNAAAELETLSDEQSIERLRAEALTLLRKVIELAVKLSKSRKKAATTLCRAAEKELETLNIKGARLSFEFEEKADLIKLEPKFELSTEFENIVSEIGLGSAGFDRGELMLSTIEGEPLKPLKRVASGGELSRITLVLKTLLKDRGGVNVMVFDEVDTGISGSIARSVGEKLRALSAHSQVICITHLAQVASLADQHILVEKSRLSNALSTVRTLKNEQQVEEIARMLAGYDITKSTRESARELITSKSARIS